MSDILLRTFMTLAERGLRLRMVVTVGGVTIRGTLVDEYFERPPSAHCLNKIVLKKCYARAIFKR